MLVAPESIDDEGTVSFAEPKRAILQETPGYACRRMPLPEVEEWANELRATYLAFAQQYR